jgi:3-deoxy-D-manno-octulosonic-acid transferase
VYLPLDTSANAKRFLDLVKPDLVIFVKYEIWPNYLLEVKKRHIKAILISALFRKNQSFFKPSGRWMQKALFAFNHIFVQNETSKQLLNNIGYTDVTISGDTRFDRVTNQLAIDNSLNFIETFKQDHLCVVVGSSWPDDEALLINFINEDISNTKYIIAPHNIKSSQIANLKTRLKQTTILYSEKDKSDLQNAKVFIIDTIGILSKIYSYADIAYVGGGLGTSGLHNTLEAAVFGVPIIIGNHYKKFPEALAMIENHGMFSISNQTALNSILNRLIIDADLRVKSGSQNAMYIKENQGAVTKIITYLNKS